MTFRRLKANEVSILVDTQRQRVQLNPSRFYVVVQINIAHDPRTYKFRNNVIKQI